MLLLVKTSFLIYWNSFLLCWKWIWCQGAAIKASGNRALSCGWAECPHLQVLLSWKSQKVQKIHSWFSLSSWQAVSPKRKQERDPGTLRNIPDFSLISCKEETKVEEGNHLNFLEQEWPRRHKTHYAGDKTLERIYIQVKIMEKNLIFPVLEWNQGYSQGYVKPVKASKHDDHA